MMNKINIKMLLGITFLITILLLSFFPSLIFTPDDLEPKKMIFNSEGKLIGSAPFSPREVPPLGTDKFGGNLFYLLIDGAKYTFFFVVIVSFLRLLTSIVLSVIYGFYLRRYSNWLKKALDVMYFIPPVFIIFFIMGPLSKQLYSEQSLSSHILLMQMILFTVIAVPPLVISLGEDMQSHLNKDFMKVAMLSGVRNFYLFKKHLIPIMKPQIFIVFLQQIVQLLILLIHLGILNIFIGGSKLIKISMVGGGAFDRISLSNEWSGLIGANYHSLFLQPWLTLAPLASFMILIIAIKLIMSGFQEHDLIKYSFSASEITQKQPILKNSVVNKEDFKLISQGTEY